MLAVYSKRDHNQRPILIVLTLSGLHYIDKDTEVLIIVISSTFYTLVFFLFYEDYYKVSIF